MKEQFLILGDVVLNLFTLPQLRFVQEDDGLSAFVVPTDGPMSGRFMMAPPVMMGAEMMERFMGNQPVVRGKQAEVLRAWLTKNGEDIMPVDYSGDVEEEDTKRSRPDLDLSED